MMKISKKVLLVIGMMLMLAGGSLAIVAATVPNITSNTVHVIFGTLPTLKVVNEGSQDSMVLTQAKTTTTTPPYGLFTPIAGGATGNLTYNVVGLTFDVSFTETDGKLAFSTSYSLIYYIDNPGWTGSGTVIVLASGTSDGSGDLAIGTPAAPVVTPIVGNLPASGDGNVLMGAKIWLVPTSDITNPALSGSPTTLTWATYPVSYEFDTALVNYYQQAVVSNTVDLWATIPTPSTATIATLNTITPAVTAYFWFSNDSKVTWYPIIPLAGVQITWGWYCGSTAATLVHYTGTAGQDDYFGVSVSPAGTVTVISPTYPSQHNP